MTLAAPLTTDRTNINLISVSGNAAFIEPDTGTWHISTASQVERISTLQQFYEIKQPGDVFQFLYDHPGFVEVVIEAVEALRNEFGADASLELELVRDPETDTTELFALVKVDLDPNTALQKLQEFDQNWLLDREEITNGLFNVDVTFR
ncbi:MAG: hypothetical protein D6715_11095 [Calditrichaeota bacterium]|nr:MAG: hypothetical protein D6715_11095 [Calditrichota bacterium]